MTREETVKNLLTELIDMIDNGSQRDLDRADEISKTIIEALSQEPCDDAISREAVVQTIEDAKNAGELTFARTIKRIMELPSVTHKSGKWIPVSERLPDDRDWYLGIFRESDTGWINPLPFVCDYVGHETKATTKEHWILRGFTDRDEHIDHYFNLECVAWMPLPKPYEPQESEARNESKG